MRSGFLAGSKLFRSEVMPRDYEARFRHRNFDQIYDVCLLKVGPFMSSECLHGWQGSGFRFGHLGKVKHCISFPSLVISFSVHCSRTPVFLKTKLCLTKCL